MLLKKDAKKIATIFNGINLNDLEMEDYAEYLNDKSIEYYEKGNDERSDSYQEAYETLTELAEAYQRLLSLLEDNEVEGI